MGQGEDETAGGGFFPSTRWSVIAKYQEGGDEAAATRALSELCEIYYFPVYAFIRHQLGSADEAYDLTQSFFERALAKDYFQRIDHEKGRMRNFLSRALQDSVKDHWRRQSAEKRDRGLTVSFDAAAAEERYLAEPEDPETPETLFDKRWARVLLGEVREALRQEYAGREKAALFEVIQPYIAWRGGEDRHAEIAAQMGMSVGAVRMAIQRCRERYRLLLERHIAETLIDPAQVNDELNHLMQAFQPRATP